MFSSSVNDLASSFAGLSLGLGLNASEYNMDIDDEGGAAIDYDMEVDAFGSDAERRASIFQGIMLLCFPLNEEIPTYTPAELDAILQKVDYIHCKAFGGPTGINRVGNQLQSAPPPAIVGGDAIVASSLCMLCTAPAAAAAAAAGAAAPQGDIILLCIVNIHGDTNQLVDIWSVAKNPQIAFPNAFQRFLRAFLEVNTTLTRVYLTVGTDNTVTMTEQGRLRLYTSLGFLIQGAQTVQLIYPDSGPLWVDSHTAANRGELLLSSGGNRYCSFLGNIQSSGAPIVMMATREDLQENHSFTLGFADSLRGRSAYLYNASRTSLTEEPNKLTDNESIPIATPTNVLVPIKALYHMGLQNYKSRTNPGNSFIQSFTVPNDFLIFTVTSPGSYLYIRQGEIERFTRSILQELANPLQAASLIRNNKSTQKHPIVNLVSEASYRESLLTPTTTQALCKKQTMAGLFAAKIMEQLGRQPIFEFQLPPGTPGGASQFQLDFQLFGPGMKLFNYIMTRSNTSGSDLANNFGTYRINTSTTPSTFTQNTGDGAFTNRLGKLRNYLDFIRASYPVAASGAAAAAAGAGPAPGPTYFLFLFGCSGLQSAANQYDLLYELSHRRSVKFRFPPTVSFDSLPFIRAAIFDKLNLGAYPCAAYGDGANLRVRLMGGKRTKHTRKQKQKKRKVQRRKTRKT
jgi:hypothetical protein